MNSEARAELRLIAQRALDARAALETALGQDTASESVAISNFENAAAELHSALSPKLVLELLDMITRRDRDLDCGASHG